MERFYKEKVNAWKIEYIYIYGMIIFYNHSITINIENIFKVLLISDIMGNELKFWCKFQVTKIEIKEL